MIQPIKTYYSDCRPTAQELNKLEKPAIVIYEHPEKGMLTIFIHKSGRISFLSKEY